MLSVLKQFAKQKARDAAHHEIPPAPHISFAVAVRPETPDRPRAPLSQQLADLQRRSCDVLGHPLVKHPAAGSLRRLGNELLAHILRLQSLWRNEKTLELTDNPALAEITSLLGSSHRLLDAVVSQLTLCSSTVRDSAVLAEWGRRLVAQEPVRFHTLLPLVDRVCDEVRRTPALRSFTPLTGLSLTAVVESQSIGAGATTFVEGLTTARLLASCIDDDRHTKERLPLLVLAALFQDVGKLSLAAGRTSAAQLAEKAHWIDRQHPALGAALFGSVRGAPMELPLIIAQHHEQLDGNGFPRSLPAAEILPESSILATAARFATLCLEQNERSATAVEYARTRAVRSLVSEAEWGRWRLDFARRIADRAAGEQADDIFLPTPAAAQFPAVATDQSADLDRNLQLHDQERSLQGVHSEQPLIRKNPGPRRVTAVRQW